METREKILLILLKEGKKTATELAETIKITRPGIWKALTKLYKDELIKLDVVNLKKTSIKIIMLNYGNILILKILSLLLTKQALQYERWVDCFSKLKEYVNFAVLFGSILNNSKNAEDIDIMIVSKKNNFNKIEEIIDDIQKTQLNKIHMIALTEQEFQKELKSGNKAYLDAVKKGIVLLGQENFIDNMEKYYGY